MTGAWRATPPDLADIDPADLRTIAPLLLAGAGAGLAWSRIRADSTLASTEAAAALREGHDRTVVLRAVREQELAALVPALNGRNVQFVLIKGWDLARRYPERGMRSPGDIDLVVRPQDLAVTRQVATALTAGPVDLVHRALEYPPASAEKLLRDHDEAILGDRTVVPVPRHEDTLRIVCVHALQSEVELPRMLCDVGALVESRPDDFDWDRCLTDDPVVAGWVRLVLRLALTMVGAELSDAPDATQGHIPQWVVPRVLRSWGRPVVRGRPAVLSIRHPRWWRSALAVRWSGPLRSAFLMGRPVPTRYRLPLQVRCYATRAAQSARRRRAL